MRHLFEDVSYLKGLAEGLEISKESKEGKLLHKIIEVLDNFAEAMVDLDEEQDRIAEYVESIDEDLADVEDDLYEDEEEYDDEDEEDMLNFIEMECPSCNDLVEIDEDLLYEDDVDIVCPNCQAIVLPADEEEDDILD